MQILLGFQFCSGISESDRAHTGPVSRSPTPISWLVVAAEPITSVDVTSADTLSELNKHLHEAGIDLLFAELKDPVKDKLKKLGIYSQLGEGSFFSTIDVAVTSYLNVHPVDWVDPNA